MTYAEYVKLIDDLLLTERQPGQITGSNVQLARVNRQRIALVPIELVKTLKRLLESWAGYPGPDRRLVRRRAQTFRLLRKRRCSVLLNNIFCATRTGSLDQFPYKRLPVDPKTDRADAETLDVIGTRGAARSGTRIVS
jgi:hypothetical protein